MTGPDSNRDKNPKCYIAGSISHVAYIIKSNRLGGGEEQIQRTDHWGEEGELRCHGRLVEAIVKTRAKFGVGKALERGTCVRASEEP